jgi:uridine kinase
VKELIPFRPLIIGIAGGTGSGKTTVATKIVAQLPSGEAVLVQHDWYYRDNSHLSFERRAQINYDEPASLENDLLVMHLRMLREGRGIDCPQYDFTTHSRLVERKPIAPRRIVVVEGILLFAVAEIRELLDLRLFVDTDDDIRLMRRIKRDILYRGRDIRSIQHQYYDTVRPMHRLWVAPSKQFAHLIIPEGGENKEAVEVIVGRLLYALSNTGPPPPG